MKTYINLLLISVTLCTIIACGQRGPLYHPQEEAKNNAYSIH